MQWETVIGLEIHAQLATKSKLFSGASTTYGGTPNVQACAIDLGLPGVLPVVNQQAIRMAIKFGLAIGARIESKSIFARKNYFYPDLPKGYQISQYERPIVSHGSVDIELSDGSTKNISVERAHLEEDAGKSVHEGFFDNTGIDLNRAGIPLLEIVSEPDLRSATEAITYMKKIHSIVRYIEICNGNMQEGSFRCDANVSIRPKGDKKLGTRAELKNLNSFRFVEQAINFEVERQKALLSSGIAVIQETRLFDPVENVTRAMRSKEDANDYRYFPDPDLLPICLEKTAIQEIKSQLPELPNAKYMRFQEQYQLSPEDSRKLTASHYIADYFEATVQAADGDAKLSANWIMGELSAMLNREDRDIGNSPVSAVMLGGMIKRIKDNTISSKIAKQVFVAMCNGEGTADEIIADQGLQQLSDYKTIEKMVDEVIIANPKQVEQYRASSDAKQLKLIAFFVGQVMKRSKGQANPQQINQILKTKLKP